MEEEILDVVDEKDRFVRKSSRKEVREKKLLHRVARVIVKNNKNESIIQKRNADKKTFPSHFDIGIAETVKSSESYESAAIRGLYEELGIFGVSNIQLTNSFLFKIRYNSMQTNEICKVYMLEYNGKINFQKEEIEEVKSLKINEVKKLIKMPFHPVGKIAFEKYLELKNNK